MAVDWLDSLWAVLSLRDYNTRVVLGGTALLGAASGMAGTFLFLRKRSLLSDTISHAALPGVVIAYMMATMAGGDGKNPLWLLVGAALTSLLAIAAVGGIRRFTRLKDDAALGIVLSVFFGAGMAFLGMATRMGDGNSSGLTSYIYGKTASMVLGDVQLISVVALVVAVMCVAFLKELTLLCFDASFASAQGWPAWLLDAVLMGLAVGVTVAGMQTVGLILVVALLVIPPAAARFWTDRLGTLMIISAAVGCASGFLGAAISAVFEKLPAGAIIVLTASAIFVVSMLFGVRRGAVPEVLRHRRLQRRIERQQLLRTIVEVEEMSLHPPSLEELGRQRGWSDRQARVVAGRAARAGLVERGHGPVQLTRAGRKEAVRAERNHRLWELYLLHHADVAPAHLSRSAESLEDVVDAATFCGLEALLEQDRRDVLTAEEARP